MSAVVSLDTMRPVPAVGDIAGGFEDLPPIMTKEELADILRVSTRTIDRLHDKNKAPKRRKLPGMDHYRYYKRDVIEWLTSEENEA